MEGNNVAFLFTDTQIVVETMLEDLNNVLNSGEIPNLFPQDEQVRFGLGWSSSPPEAFWATQPSPVRLYATPPAIFAASLASL